MSGLSEAVACYLATRRSLGFRLEGTGQLLEQFAAFAEAAGQDTVTTELALQWATLPASRSRAWHAQRLSAVRGFARWLHAIDPRTQVPPGGLLPGSTRRPTPYLYSEADITALTGAAGRLTPPWKAITVRTLTGLLFTTGVRLGEALSLESGDLDPAAGLLTIRQAKFRHGQGPPEGDLREGRRVEPRGAGAPDDRQRAGGRPGSGRYRGPVQRIAPRGAGVEAGTAVTAAVISSERRGEQGGLVAAVGGRFARGPTAPAARQAFQVSKTTMCPQTAAGRSPSISMDCRRWQTLPIRRRRPVHAAAASAVTDLTRPDRTTAKLGLLAKASQNNAIWADCPKLLSQLASALDLSGIDWVIAGGKADPPAGHSTWPGSATSATAAPARNIAFFFRMR